ncbi:MAG: adenylyl-sulfate reductase subunit alpha [Desulfovibrionaceae bacterium]|nr:adenylyl-sulfate reductase subunit alpha [Desulfovibrionaceae bacterium]
MALLPIKEKSKGIDLAEPTVKEHDVDILIVGGGMGSCGAAYEAARWGKKEGVEKIMLCDKACLERSGAVAQGLSAINTYIGNDRGNTPDDYVRMVRTDLMGLVREDLIFDVGRHVDDSVHLFESWGLPCWIKQPDGKHNWNGAQAKAQGKSLRAGDPPVRSGKWQIMINGESYKCIVAEAAKNALGEDRYMERIFIVKLLLDANTPNRIAGAVGFSTRENVVHIFRTNAMLVACGGAVNVYRPRSTGEGMGRAWYPVWNAGSTYTMCAQVGAEMTMMENRFVPARFKDGYGPVGAWFLLFKAKATNYKGEDYCKTNAAMLKPYEDRGYAKGNVVPTCLRNHMMLREMREGRGPIYMDTKSALLNTFATMNEEEQKDLESEAWEDFLDMCVGQANLWAASNRAPEERGSEIMPTEPYLLGSHSGCCGIWASGPDEKWVPDSYKVKASNGKVYNRMTTVEGLFTCADGVGASGHKFSSGSHVEGRIAGKQLVRWVKDHADFKPTLKDKADDLVKEIYRPYYNFLAGKDASTDPVVNPNYISPKNFMMRLIKATDEYGGGVGTYYTTSKALLDTGFDLLTMMEEDSLKLAARDLHELLRCWENYHRLWTVRLHMQHIAFREETRYPGFYYRADFMGIDDSTWKCFVNSKYDPATGKTTVFKKPYYQIIPD